MNESPKEENEEEPEGPLEDNQNSQEELKEVPQKLSMLNEFKPEEQNEISHDMSGAFPKQQTLSESVSVKDMMDDAYYQGLEELVDIALHAITAKLSEKKSAELENSSLKVMIAKVKEDIKREDQVQKTLKKSIEQERESRKKKERENLELKETLDIMNEKADDRKNEINKRLTETQTYYDEIKDSTAKERVKIENIKRQLKDMSVEVRNEIRSLELANAEAIGFLEELKKKSDYDRIVKSDRLKSIKQKSKLLASLIGQDSPLTKTSSMAKSTPRKNTGKGIKGK